MRIATFKCGCPLLCLYSCSALEIPFVMTYLASGRLPLRICSAIVDKWLWIESTTSSTLRGWRSRSSTLTPTSLERTHQSRRTRSRPFISFSYETLPWASRSKRSAAYFFFFSKSIIRYTPSISITSVLYSLFTARFSSRPILKTSSMAPSDVIRVLIMTESVSP